MPEIRDKSLLHGSHTFDDGQSAIRTPLHTERFVTVYTCECGAEYFSSVAAPGVLFCDDEVLTECEANPEETTDADFLREVAENLRNVAPCDSNMDGYHTDRLQEIAGKLDRVK